MGLLDEFQSLVPGYFREGEEERFPWSATNGVWYALLCVEDGKLVRYGFTSAKGQKAHLMLALRAIPKGSESLLLGIWPGQWGTHLFVLDSQAAKRKLAELP
jgi:hypothetical protein